MKRVVSLMWIVGMTILGSAIVVHNIVYQICAVIIGDTLAIYSIVLQRKEEEKEKTLREEVKT